MNRKQTMEGDLGTIDLHAASVRVAMVSDGSTQTTAPLATDLEGTLSWRSPTLRSKPCVRALLAVPA